jgi:predicted DNA-binding protein with PD1-like motif
MQRWRFKKGRIYLLKLETGDDLLDSISEFIQDKQIECGEFCGIGALTAARLGFYDHENRTYKEIAYDKTVEIANLIGNISIRDAKPFVHAHMTISDETGAAFGGHVMPGCKVFACEMVIKELEGDAPIRGYDKATGLYLWKNPEEVGQ